VEITSPGRRARGFVNPCHFNVACPILILLICFNDALSVNIYYRKPSYDVLDVLGLGIDDDQFKPASEGRYCQLCTHNDYFRIRVRGFGLWG
jgi:hypothetical protein